MLCEQSMVTPGEDHHTDHTSQAIPNTKVQQPHSEESEESSLEESEDESVEDSISTSHLLLNCPSPSTDKTMRTDYTTVGTQSQVTHPFITDEELERISECS